MSNRFSGERSHVHLLESTQFPSSKRTALIPSGGWGSITYPCLRVPPAIYCYNNDQFSAWTLEGTNNIDTLSIRTEQTAWGPTSQGKQNMVCVCGGVPSGGGEGGKGQLEETMTSSGDQGHGRSPWANRCHKHSEADARNPSRQWGPGRKLGQLTGFDRLRSTNEGTLKTYRKLGGGSARL